MRKVLTDEAGNAIGTGLPFTARILDGSGNVVSQVKLIANGNIVEIKGLQSGAVYAVQEMTGEHFTLKGYDYGGETMAERECLIFRSTSVREDSSGHISITLYNLSRPEDVESIEDPDVPLFPGFPTDEEIIEIPSEEVPLAGLPPTGDDGQSIYMLAGIFVLSSLALTLLLAKKRVR
ncbi:LPXTG-motif cell wall-anchored protein [Anaerotaenia torta]